MNSIFYQILLGSFVIPITVLVQVVFIQVAMKQLRKIEAKTGFVYGQLSTLPAVYILSLCTLWLLAALSLAIWIWAGFFQILQCFETLEESLYFSMVAFTTLGFGDVTLPPEWRILSGMIAANGLVLFGLNTAFLFEVLHRTIVRAKRD
jgi:hypothetical protein